MKKFTAILLSALLLVAVFTVAASAESNTVSVRIEGVNENLYYKDYTFAEGETVLDALKAIDKSDDGIETVIDENGYLSSINGVAAAKFGGWDGWMYAVNNVSAMVGMSDYKLASGDKVVIYYGDYPCALPVVDYSKANQGIITFTSEETDWTSGDPVAYTAPVAAADVKLNGDEYVTNSEGEIKFAPTLYTGFVSVQINRYAASGAPSVCRFASDYGFDMAAVATPDEASKDESTPDETVEPTETTSTEPVTETEPVTAEPTAATEPTQATEATTATEAAKPAVKPEPVKKATTVNVPAKKTLYVKGTYTIKSSAVLNPVGKTSYTSSNKKVVKVTSNGKVTALKKGSATVTVKNNGVKKTIKITVKNPKLNKKKLTLKVKKTFKIKVKGQAGKLSFKSSRKSVAKVSKKGLVKAIKRGKTTITVKTNGMTLKLKITVK